MSQSQSWTPETLKSQVRKCSFTIAVISDISITLRPEPELPELSETRKLQTFDQNKNHFGHIFGLHQCYAIMDINRDKPFPILQLPRELRDEVWRYTVARSKIFISFGRLEDLQQKGFCPVRPLRTCMGWENEDGHHGEGVHHQQSGTYFRPRKFEDFWNKDESEGDCDFDFEVDYDKLSVGFPALDVQRTENKHPDLSIFFTCRQISAEARDMYYSENSFVFCLINFGASDCNATSANAAWSFLRDRPRAMLSKIKHIELYLYGWDECDGFQILDPQVWQDLMGTVKSDMKLQHLSLHFRGRLADLRGSDANAESSMNTDEEDPIQDPRVTELIQLPKLGRLTIHFSGFREPKPKRDRHIHRRACFTARSHDICRNAESALQFAALAKVLRSNLLWNGQMLGSKNIRAQLAKEPEPVGNDTDFQDPDTRHDRRPIYILSMQSDDDAEGNSLLPQQHPKPPSYENGNDQAEDEFIDIFEPLGDSASLDRVKTRGRRSD